MIMGVYLSFLTMAAFSRRSFVARCLCDCQDAGRCRCARSCRCHWQAVCDVLGEARKERARPPAPTFAVIPSGPMLWGQDRRTTVLCRACGSILRPGVKREVRMLDKGLWEHVDCRTAARVPRGARGLERLLRGSVRS